MSSTYEINAVTGKLDKVQDFTETIAHADLSDMPDTGGTNTDHDAAYVRRNGTLPLTANWDVGNFTVTANNFTVDGSITDGTASLTGGSLSGVTLVTPDLGTPSAGVLSSCTAYEGTAIASTGEGGASKFLREDGDGTCSWQAALTSVVGDTTPQLGGDLDLNTHDIIGNSTTNLYLGATSVSNSEYLEISYNADTGGGDDLLMFYAKGLDQYFRIRTDATNLTLGVSGQYADPEVTITDGLTTFTGNITIGASDPVLLIKDTGSNTNTANPALLFQNSDGTEIARFALGSADDILYLINKEQDGDFVFSVNDGGIQRVAMQIHGDNGAVSMPRQSGASGYLSGDQSITTTTYTKISFDTEFFDILGEFDTTANRFTATEAGLYSVSFNAKIDDLDAPQFMFNVIYVNGSRQYSVVSESSRTAQQCDCSVSATIQLAIGGYIEFYSWQNGGTQTILSGGNATYFSIVKVA